MLVNVRVVWIGFNPTLVRLRRHDGGGVPGGVGGFNPTLVRLRPTARRRDGERRPKFQSHAGSIEASDGARARLLGSAVSIPRWFD